MNIAQHVIRASKIAPTTPATIYQRRSHTWQQFCQRTGRLAFALRMLGVTENDRVAILSQNSDRYLECFYGIPWMGAIMVPMNTRWSVQENLYALNDSGAEVLLVDDSYVETASELIKLDTNIREVIYLGDGDTPRGMKGYESIIETSEFLAPALRSESDPAGIIYTGGTTGFPKGVVIPMRGFNFHALLNLSQCGIDETSVGLHVCPMFHIADAALNLPITAAAGTHVIMPFFDSEEMLKNIEEHQITHALIVPTMLKMLVDSPSIGTANLESLKRILYGASSITETLIKDAMKKLPNAEFTQAYGQSEASGVTLLGPSDHRPELGKLRSAGRPAPGVDITIVDEYRRPVAAGISGEIVIRSPNRMLEYWQKPEETSKALVDDAVYTGDAGYIDEDGYVYVQDRIKDMIVTGGENVYCAEVENAMATHDAVKECAVIGVADETWGENVHAIVVLHEGATVSKEALTQHCRDLIAGYKCPRSIDFRSEPLPLSGAGKVLKTELRKGYQVRQQQAV